MIKDLEIGFNGTIRALIRDVHKGVTSKGAPYLSLIVQDKSGEIESKFWSVSEECLNSLSSGDICDITGDVISYNKNMQFRIQELKHVETDVDLAEYTKSSSFSKLELMTAIEQYIGSINNQKIGAIVKSLYEDYKVDFITYPAAKSIHHDYIGGLATHVIGMCKIGEFLIKMYPLLNHDLLIAGIFLHDMGKLVELNGGAICEYSNEGRLLGHISIMQAMVYEKAMKLKIEGEEITLLRHMILSHHGAFEFGSPVLAMIPEAEILAMIDNMDARMSSLEKALSGVKNGEFSKRQFALENRAFYKMHLSNTDNIEE